MYQSCVLQDLISVLCFPLDANWMLRVRGGMNVSVLDVSFSFRLFERHDIGLCAHVYHYHLHNFVLPCDLCEIAWICIRLSID